MERRTLNIELGGILAGAEYDQLNFSGAGLLDGILNVSLINGFQPQGGQTFTIIDGGALSGAFDAIALPALDPAFSWLYSQNANGARLIVVPEPAGPAIFALSAGALICWRRSRGDAPEIQESSSRSHPWIPNARSEKKSWSSNGR